MSSLVVGRGIVAGWEPNEGRTVLGYLAGLLPGLLAHWERTGRPHFVVMDEAGAVLTLFAHTHGSAEPNAAENVERGEMLTRSRTDPAPRRFKVIPGKSERRRCRRAYARGKLGDDKAVFFRGAKGKLRLRATSLTMFLEMADGVDDATWVRHRDRCDSSTCVDGCTRTPI